MEKSAEAEKAGIENEAADTKKLCFRTFERSELTEGKGGRLRSSAGYSAVIQ